MELWAQEHVDLAGPGTLQLKRNGEGEMTFIAVRCWLDCEPADRGGRPGCEFSWEGVDEGDSRCGRGWAKLGETDDTLEGRLYFHMGDVSSFKAERVTKATGPGARRKGRRPTTR
jgi:hypothetical protein